MTGTVESRVLQAMTLGLEAEAIIADMVRRGLIRPFRLSRQFYEITALGRQLAARHAAGVEQ